jgi:hypothetical protein
MFDYDDKRYDRLYSGTVIRATDEKLMGSTWVPAPAGAVGKVVNLGTWRRLKRGVTKPKPPRRSSTQKHVEEELAEFTAMLSGRLQVILQIHDRGFPLHRRRENENLQTSLGRWMMGLREKLYQAARFEDEKLEYTPRHKNKLAKMAAKKARGTR